MSQTPDRFFNEAAFARLYDAICETAGREDYDFYLPHILAAGSVLDIGCGTGTILEEARAAGHTGRLTGIDPADGMMEIARQKLDIDWVCGFLETQNWEDQFDLAVMTGHAFQVLIGNEQIASFLAAVHAALKPGGRFAFETRNPGARAWDNWTGNKAKQITVDNTQYTDRREVIRPFDGQTVTFTHTFNSPDWPEPQVSTSTLRFLSADALNAALTNAGFSIQSQYGDWDGSPVTDTSPEIITIAAKA
ncbi:class I SAM-dependent methyltransferase [Henriciella sp. AS95]|uniref:class I SAM-dependent methyltransferase n=1 Tax=Henriciella sp. AS95 TaxID=3135782 RepID=UPI00317F3DEF